MTRKVLCVDDEPNVLQAFERQFRHRFELTTAEGSKKGLIQLAAAGPFAVVVSDLRMPEMDGIEFLRRVREQWPETVRIMLTGQADLGASIDAVNRGNIFQFLTKPCPAEMLGRTLDAALEQHRLVTAERELLEQTLRGSIEVMSQILGLVNPAAFSRAERIRRYVVHIARKLELTNQWQYELAAMLSQIGSIAVPQELLEKYFNAQPLNASERTILASQGQVAHTLLAQIPRLGDVAAIILHMQDAPNQSALVRTGAILLRTATDFDELIVRGCDVDAALGRLRQAGRCPGDYLDALEEVKVEQSQEEVQLLTVPRLRPGMITNSRVFSKTGLLIMGVGQEISASAIARLATFSTTVGIEEPISVRIPKSVQKAGP